MLSAAVVGWAERLVESLRSDHHYAHCSVYLHAAETDVLLLAAKVSRPAPADLAGPEGDREPAIRAMTAVPLEGTAVGSVFRTGAPALVADTALDPVMLGVLGDRSRSVLAVPIVVGGQVIGVLNVESSRVGTFGITDLERLLASLGDAVRAFPTALLL